MKIPFEHRVNWLVRNLEANISEKANWRYAGALEICLQELGVIDEKLPEYQLGGKCFIPCLLDFRWKENYPEMILRVAKEYISKQ